MPNWNPSSTADKGLEWFPSRSGVVTLDARAKAAAVSFVQTTSEATGFVKVPISAIPTRGGVYAVEVYDNENGVPANLTLTTCVPNEDVSGTGTGDNQWQTQAGSGTTIYTTIDEGAAFNTTDYIRIRKGTARYYGRMNTGTPSLTGKRIVAVQLNIVPSVMRLIAGLNIGGVDYTVMDQWVYNIYVYNPAVATLYYNPATKKPWTIADVQAFDTTDEWWVQTGQYSASYVNIYAAWMNIIYTDENRLAVGGLDDSASALTTGWNTVTVTTPTGGTWTKDASGSHLYTVRRLTDTGVITIPYLEAVDAFTGMNGWDPTLDTTYGLITAMNAATKRIVPIINRTTVPADSVDSLPYRDLLDSEVYSGRNAEQEFSNAAAVSYGLLRFLVKNTGTTADLLIKVKRRSDNVQLGGTATLTAAAFNALATIVNGIKEVKIALASNATLATGTQYYIEFSSTAAGASACWSVQALDTGDNGNAATFGGTTDRGTVDGSEADRYDIPVTLSTVPVTPANFAGALQTQALSGATICGVTTIPKAHLSWSATALGGAFAYYEIQRSGDGGATWTTIARITTEATVAYDDYESRLGTTSGYRIRAVRNTGAASDWSSTANVAKGAPTCGTVYFVSNFDPTYNVAYEIAPSKTYDFNEAGELVTQAVYGRDGSVAFVPLENRGVSEHYTVKLGVDDMVPLGGGKGVKAFDPLRNIAHAPLPYVCVLDHYGNRIFAALHVPSGSNEESSAAGLYYADLTCIEVAAEPYVA